MNISTARLKFLKDFKALLRDHPGYRALWSAGVVSQLGDWLSYIAVSAFVFSEGGGVFGLAAVYLAHVLPYAFLGGFIGPLVDRFDRRRLLMLADGARGLITLLMVLAAANGAVIALEILLVLRVSVGTLGLIAGRAALPRLVPRDAITSANALSALTWSTLLALGVALGGICPRCSVHFGRSSSTPAPSSSRLASTPACPPSARCQAPKTKPHHGCARPSTCSRAAPIFGFP